MMRMMLFAFCLLVSGWGSAVSAKPEVRVLETYPAGQSITLPRNQDFYLRLAYASDTPVGIWINPYFRGKEVPAGTSPSPRYSGKGEALGWFFFTNPGQRVDEIRIKAGDGGYDTPVVATYRVNVTAGSRPALDPSSPWAPNEPQWIGYMREESKKQLEARMNATQRDSGPAAFVFLGGFMLIVLGLGIVGAVAPIWAMRRWEGGWRLAAAAPLGLLGLVILRIIVETSIDPTSHNLWPFEVLMASFASLGAMVLFAVLRRVRSNAGNGA